MLHRCQVAADSPESLIRPLRSGRKAGHRGVLTSGQVKNVVSSAREHSGHRICLLFALIVIQANGVNARDSFLDRWNRHGANEGTDTAQKLMLDPTERDERELSDEISRHESESAQVRSDFDLTDFTQDFGAPAADREQFTSFRRPQNDRGEIVGEPFSQPAESFEAPRSAEEFLGEMPGRSELNPDAVFSNAPGQYSRCEQWQILPAGLLYHSYLAGEKEPRMQFLHLYDTRNDQTYWEAVLGGRVGLLRHGTVGATNPEGFQLDVEGAVFARVLPTEPSAQLAASDYRAGLAATWRQDRTAYKAGFYHISAHVGDEFLLANPLFTRINYVRDSLVAGTVYELDLSSKIYGEVAYAIGSQGGAEALELQFGTEYSPTARSSLRGAPFAAVNGHLREDFDFRGGVNVVSGWGWQGVETKHRLRLGMQYYNGPSLQYEFFDRWENLVGGGLWLDY